MSTAEAYFRDLSANEIEAVVGGMSYDQAVSDAQILASNYHLDYIFNDAWVEANYDPEDIYYFAIEDLNAGVVWIKNYHESTK